MSKGPDNEKFWMIVTALVIVLVITGLLWSASRAL